MFIVSPLRTSLPVMAGLLVLVGACTKEADRTPPAEKATSTPPAGTQQTTATRRDNTAADVDTAAIVAAQTVPVPPPSASKPRVRPSIDPGRKPPATKPVSAPAAPAPDTAAPSEPAQAAGQGQPVKYDASTNTVTFDLIAGPFNWNGFASGGATLLLPAKSNVVMNFVNKDGTPHSAEVISGQGPIPNAAVDPAIPRAYTNKVLEGLPQEGSDVMRFTVPESGTYRIFCGVPGHGLSGMWIWMKVDPKAKAPSFGPTKS